MVRCPFVETSVTLLVSMLNMRSATQEHPEVMPRLAITAIFLCTAASIASVFLHVPAGLQGSPRERWLESAAVAGAVLFLCASVLVFFKPRFGYWFGLLAGLVVAPWYVWTELALGPAVN